MKTILKLLFATALILSFSSGKVERLTDFPGGKTINPFDTLKFDKVIAYDYDGVGERSIVLPNNQLMVGPKIKKQAELSVVQYKKLNVILGDKTSYGGGTAACFEPHFGVVYYNKNKIVGHISICLSCNYHVSKPDIPAQNSHKTDLCAECYAYGFSKKGRKQISELVKELKFSHWELNSGLFDK